MTTEVSGFARLDEAPDSRDPTKVFTEVDTPGVSGPQIERITMQVTTTLARNASTNKTSCISCKLIGVKTLFTGFARQITNNLIATH